MSICNIIGKNGKQIDKLDLKRLRYGSCSMINKEKSLYRIVTGTAAVISSFYALDPQ